ncbi:hypothetical protein L083_3623 [Actinoplanes sp. N902-109]|nr:hypothetical protein L083_3623 [Actinoplanes sp. N902-109]
MRLGCAFPGADGGCGTVNRSDVDPSPSTAAPSTRHREPQRHRPDTVNRSDIDPTP